MNDRRDEGKSETELLSIVIQGLAQIAPRLTDAGKETRLIGEAAVIDSIGFVTLLMEVEQRLDGQLDLAASFLDQEAGESQTNPFRTVGTLVHHLQVLTRRRP